MSLLAETKFSECSTAEKFLPADLETPVSAYLKLKPLYPGKPSFLFESVEKGERVGRYSILGFQSTEILNWRCGENGNPFHLLQERIEQVKKFFFKSKSFSKSSFFPLGAYGYFGYDVIRALEKIPGPKEKLPFPDAFFSLPERMVLFDHVKNMMTLLVLTREGEAQAELKKMEEGLQSQLLLDFSNRRKSEFFSLDTKESFIKKVEKAKEYIRSGEIFQVVLSQKFQGETSADPISIYRALRILNPSPYMFYLDLAGSHLIGSSPEMFIKVENNQVETHPIAGTKRRGVTEEEEERLTYELLQDPKERAEHTMLVDLGRNDLGKVCDFGTVKVADFMRVEKYSHVMHMVSKVQGGLSSEKYALQSLEAAFPAGTVTGAPKVRAMQIIEELESRGRGPYAGCVGYVSFWGNLDTCITIRTVFMSGKTVYLQAGAGIVADSDPESEYQEILNKIEGMKQAVLLAEENLQYDRHD